MGKNSNNNIVLDHIKPTTTATNTKSYTLTCLCVCFFSNFLVRHFDRISSDLFSQNNSQCCWRRLMLFLLQNLFTSEYNVGLDNTAVRHSYIVAMFVFSASLLVCFNNSICYTHCMGIKMECVGNQRGIQRKKMKQQRPENWYHEAWYVWKHVISLLRFVHLFPIFESDWSLSFT